MMLSRVVSNSRGSGQNTSTEQHLLCVELLVPRHACVRRHFRSGTGGRTRCLLATGRRRAGGCHRRGGVRLSCVGRQPLGNLLLGVALLPVVVRPLLDLQAVQKAGVKICGIRCDMLSVDTRRKQSFSRCASSRPSAFQGNCRSAQNRAELQVQKTYLLRRVRLLCALLRGSRRTLALLLRLGYVPRLLLLLCIRVRWLPGTILFGTILFGAIVLRSGPPLRVPFGGRHAAEAVCRAAKAVPRGRLGVYRCWRALDVAGWGAKQLLRAGCECGARERGARLRRCHCAVAWGAAQCRR